MTEESIATEYGNLQKQVIHLYTGMRDGHFLIDNAMMASLSDEAEYTLQGNAQTFNSGSWNQYVNPDDVWSHYYSLMPGHNLPTRLPALFHETAWTVLLHQTGYIVPLYAHFSLKMRESL